MKNKASPAIVATNSVVCGSRIDRAKKIMNSSENKGFGVSAITG